jgi:hypothetical protein
VETLVIPVLGIAVALGLLFWRARDAITICVIEVERGRAKIKRGGMAPRVFSDIGDVVKKPRVARATIRVVRSRDRAKVEVSGKIGDAQVQQLRNVIGSVPLAKLVNARRR